MKRGLLRMILLAVLVIPVGCATGISKEELLKEIQEGHAPLIVDVRSSGEYDRDHVPGAVHIPFTSVRSGLQEKMAAKGEPIVLYCEHGPRAGIAALLLYFSGYSKLYSLDGHMRAWRREQFPIKTMRTDP